jgi:lipopolysaccharide transport system permease protein
VSTAEPTAAGYVPDIRRHGAGYRLDVLGHLVRIELATRNRGSLLGWLWALGPPLFQLLATYFVFTQVIPLDVPNYPVFLLCGILSWTWFARSLGEGVVSLEQRRELVVRPGFATWLIPLVSVIVALVDFMLALPVLIVALALTTGLHAESVVLPVLLAIQFCLCAGLALAFAPLQVFLRDVRQLVALGVSVGFWITPVFYARRQVPDSLAWLYDVNPMAHLIAAQRLLLLEGELPELVPTIVLALVSVAILACGWIIFRACRQQLPENL